MYALNLRPSRRQQRSSGVSVETYRTGLDDMAAEARELIDNISELKQRAQQVRQYLEEDIGAMNAADPSNPAISEMEELRNYADNILAFFSSF
ncbi:conserved hypothetical protein [Hyphomicrobium denitrificans ATCC 51888]|uniref:Uncharacterized protein n=1 Tax=Hyphomicrobium denitrificans (strain ATCC 51888 / DSM 1869 / NCIMB 11706 / TK 0415) TaxID=582899 RepID=D8JVC2_HYPDA|nr:hypothetical protein [Hyphomicrobium denitrificans]ADJ24776.1 conserved hypothetical protein [Hyphomicrobium denitrificans ATCC 51888]